MRVYCEQIRELFFRLTLRQRILIGAAAVVVLGGIFGFRYWQNEKNFKPLFQNLAAEDAGPILAALREKAIEVRLTEDGRTIRVPSEKIDELRIQLASAGLPKSGRIGFEIFDKANFGASEFTEQVNYHRAIEGELERSVMAMQEVESARVHITFPRKTLFMENQQPAKASVLVKLKPGAELSKPNFRAITHLAASAVEGLAPDQVSVLDMKGNLLIAPKAGEEQEQELSKALLDYRRKMEEDLLRKIQSTLGPLLGPDGFRASVSLDCDMASGDQSEETFDPSRSVMLNSQKSEDGSASAAPSGVPGTPTNLPRPQSRPSTTASSPLFRRSENTTFQTSRLVRHIKFPQGQIKRLSAAVLLDHMVRTDGGKRVSEPAPPEKLRAIKDLVAATVGFQQDRGDQIIVETMPFEATRNPNAPAATVAGGTAPPLPRITLPQAIPAWLRVPLEGHLNWFVQQSWLPPLIVLLTLGPLYGIYRLFRKMGSALAAAGGKAVALVKRKKKGQHVDVTLDGAIEGAEGVKQIEGAEGGARKSVEEQLADRIAEQERLTQEAVLQLDVPKAEVRKAEVLSRHIVDLVKKDSESVANLIRTWVVELER
jgi:flagellar M-ring protein FliF